MKAIDLTPMIERYRSDGDEIRISTAPGRDGIVRRIAVKAREAGTRPDWIVFALTNDTDEQVDRLLVAPHFRLTGSGVIWPDLGSSRIAAITASEGIRPEREDSADADVFLITLDPGTTVTFVAELRSDEPAAALPVGGGRLQGARQRADPLQGHHHRHRRAARPVPHHRVRGEGRDDLPGRGGARLGGARLCLHRFRLLPAHLPDHRDGRARSTAPAPRRCSAATLLVFLFAYLNLNRWHVRYSHVTAFWLLFLGALVGLAVFDPPVASGVARISIAAVAGIGFVLVIHLATHGYDRAVMLVPTWLLLIAWVAAASFTVVGQLPSDLVPPALIGGLVLIVMLIGFTVMQHAFAGGGFAQGFVSDTERRALALSGAGDIVFDWDVAADRIFVSPEVEQPARAQARRRSKGRPPPGSTSSIPSTATATAPPSTP